MTVFERSPYLELHESGELRERAQQALRLLDGRCLVCPACARSIDSPTAPGCAGSGATPGRVTLPALR
jgi:hypothetical protein